MIMVHNRYSDPLGEVRTFSSSDPPFVKEIIYPSFTRSLSDAILGVLIHNHLQLDNKHERIANSWRLAWL